MKIRNILNVLTACALMVCMQSCTGEEQPNFVVPTPGPDKETDKEDNGGGQTQEPTAYLCSPEHLGQTPMIIAY